VNYNGLSQGRWKTWLYAGNSENLRVLALQEAVKIPGVRTISRKGLATEQGILRDYTPGIQQM